MMKIQLTARLSYAGSITEGKYYIPLAQTKTGFLIKGDDGVDIDLYGHFFRIGAVNETTGETIILSEKINTTKTNDNADTLAHGVAHVSKEEPKKELPKEKYSLKPQKLPVEKPILKEEEPIINEPKKESPIDNLIDDDDDF